MGHPRESQHEGLEQHRQYCCVREQERDDLLQCKGLKQYVVLVLRGIRKIDGVVHGSHTVRDSTSRQHRVEFRYTLVIERDLWKDR